MKRRDFVLTSALGLSYIGLAGTPLNVFANQGFVGMRPAREKRTYISKAVEEELALIKKEIADPEIAWLFENCYPNTLDTTVRFSLKGEEPDTFIITGDINAMWLRDSTAQVWPYLHLVNKDEALKELFKGLKIGRAQV